MLLFWPDSCSWVFFSLLKASFLGTSSTIHPCHWVFSFILLLNRHFNLTNGFGTWKILIFSDLWLMDSRSSRNSFKTKIEKNMLKEVYYIGRWAKEAEFCVHISFPKFTSAVNNAGSFKLLGWEHQAACCISASLCFTGASLQQNMQKSGQCFLL